MAEYAASHEAMPTPGTARSLSSKSRARLAGHVLSVRPAPLMIAAGLALVGLTAATIGILAVGLGEQHAAREARVQMALAESERLRVSLHERDRSLDLRAGLAPAALTRGLSNGRDTAAAMLSPALGARRVPETISLPPIEPAARTETVTIAMPRGGTLMGVLLDAGADQTEASALIDALRPVLDPRRLQAGQPVKMTFLSRPEPSTRPAIAVRAGFAPYPQIVSTNADTGMTWPTTTDLMELRIKTAIDQQVLIRRVEDASYEARTVPLQLDERLVRVQGTIESSLFASAHDLGVPDRVIIDLVQILAYSIDFQREIRRGDAFELLYSTYLDAQTGEAKPGRIHYASITNGGKTRTLFRFEDGEGRADYFDANGQSVKQFLMRTPVNAVRISSRFGRRFHPIQKRWKAHQGVDFAAPTGTKIYAAGTGTITFAGKASGYGNLIKIQHSNGYETRYGHMSRMASGIRKGAKVSQGQVIGYVGATGWATGPHLHYEVRASGNPVDPLSVKVPTGRTLAGTELAAFRTKRDAIIDQKLALAPVTTTQTAKLSVN